MLSLISPLASGEESDGLAYMFEGTFSRIESMHDCVDELKRT